MFRPDKAVGLDSTYEYLQRSEPYISIMIMYTSSIVSISFARGAEEALEVLREFGLQNRVAAWGSPELAAIQPPGFSRVVSKLSLCEPSRDSQHIAYGDNCVALSAVRN